MLMEQVMEPSDQATVSDVPEACQYTINTITTPASPLPEEDIDEEEETMGDTPEETEGRAVTMAGAAPGAKHGARDSSWLELEVCREFLRKNCSRSADECRFAHPPDSVIVKDRKVTCCFDFLKDRCNRDTCKYLHPPNAIKDKLVMAGKQYGQQIATTYKPTMPIQQGGGGTPFNQSIPMSGNYISFVSTSPIPQIVPQLDTSAFPFPPPPPPQLPVIPPNIEVCEDFANNVTCPHGNSCYYAHPEPHVRRNSDNTVNFCWNYLRGYCRHHHQCWFFHPPPHIMSALNGSIPSPQQIYLDPLMMPTYFAAFGKSPYSSPTSSLNNGATHYAFPIQPIISQYSPTSVTMPTMPHPPVTGSLPQTIVK